MTTETETAIAHVVAAIEEPDDLDERCRRLALALEQAPAELRLARQRLSLALRADGRTWSEVGAALGGVSAQRAQQYSIGK